VRGPAPVFLELGPDGDASGRDLADLGAINGYVIAQWRFRGANLIFALMLFGCFIPFQVVLLPMARTLGMMGLAGTIPGLIFVHVIYGIGFTTLFFRNYYVTIPQELVKAAKVDGAGFFRIFWSIFLPLSRCRSRGHRDLAIHPDLERLPVRRVVQPGRHAADHGRAQQHRQLHHRREGIQRRHGRRDHRRAAHACSSMSSPANTSSAV
jgi:hypothetical protein